ncbi:hypothetical protein [Burkholderia oklahomensis]|uniref:Uncharacterized protein n=1 Tax=Burkholderia oklahomensis TaxID=342113 RepID=A0AAI8BF28_9BURK|nr:hypothetical protein [Burkholderia oklahomensis]AIO70988.1 hypothetical protein DM82_5485 [Burkholderia oklahomensis]QPS40534.1 hypothetical protein I6G57_19500 [Burkholderia oklahomensis]
MTTGFSREPHDVRSFTSGAGLVVIVTAIAAVVGGVVATQQHFKTGLLS